ncbi:hypothetical protein Q0M94_18130 (plasmid) [Deinococcus radiomollis]|uniref:hypothetical protein n=1 Tax=Deinococcus radiomollis TaxID=468916 RepID=UPI003892BE07
MEMMTLDLEQLGRVLLECLAAVEADPTLQMTVTDETVAAFESLLLEPDPTDEFVQLRP